MSGSEPMVKSPSDPQIGGASGFAAIITLASIASGSKGLRSNMISTSSS